MYKKAAARGELWEADFFGEQKRDKKREKRVEKLNSKKSWKMCKLYYSFCIIIIKKKVLWWQRWMHGLGNRRDKRETETETEIPFPNPDFMYPT